MVRWIDRLLLGRYMLIELIQGLWSEQFAAVTHARGISGILVADCRPLLARGEEVRQLRMQENARGYVPTPPKPNRFAKQQRVLITRGAFVDQIARYVAERGHEDHVELDVLGKATSIFLPLGCLIAA